MQARPFESGASLGSRRAIIRRNPADMQEIEMIEAGWGLETRDEEKQPFRFVRVEGRSFASHRCLVPASEIHIGNGDDRFRVTLDDGNFFYLAGIWRPSDGIFGARYAIVTIDANPDIALHQDRQGAVLLRRQRMAWLDLTEPEDELLRPLPARSFRVENIATLSLDHQQRMLAL